MKASFVPLAAGQQMIDARHVQTITLSIEQAGDASRIAEAITTMLRERHGRGKQATRASGLGGNQLPGVTSSVDDFTVKTQAAANVTKGLYNLGRRPSRWPTCRSSTRSRCRKCRARSAAPDRR
jgi:hypothetical protein